MYGYLKKPLSPRNGVALEVWIVARISGCQNQKEDSLDDQIDRGKEAVRDLYQGPVNFHSIATKGKGERLDREELVDVEKLLRSRTVDLLFVEDLGRLVRGTEAVRLLGVAVDHGTRVISPNDLIDTSESTWEEDAISACRDHVSHNAQTSKRLKHKLMNRFLKYGAATPVETVAYEVPERAKTFADWKKNPAVEKMILEGFRRLRESLNCSAVADWFNRESMPVGPYCRSKTWNGAMVRRLYKNPMLKGKPGRGFKVTVKHNELGIRHSINNPDGPRYVEFPHLAYFTEADFDDLNVQLEQKNANFRRKPVAGIDPQFRVPRKRTRFPGQHARCWYCGRHYVWGGNGMTDNLMCAGARGWRCWNSIGFSGPTAANKLVEAIVQALRQLQGFDEQFAELVRSAREAPEDELRERLARLEHDEKSLAKEKANLLEAILSFGAKPMLNEKLVELEQRERDLFGERSRLDLLKQKPIEIPRGVSEICDGLIEEFSQLAIKSPDFGDLMRKLVPEMSIFLVRLCDGGHLMPRARVKLNLGGSIPDIARVPALNDFFTRELVIDLFDPPQREVIRPEAFSLACQSLMPKAIAARLSEKPTATAVGNALALHRRMLELGLSSPYVAILEPPADYSKLRRHKNEKFRFEPLKDYDPPTIE